MDEFLGYETRFDSHGWQYVVAWYWSEKRGKYWVPCD